MTFRIGNRVPYIMGIVSIVLLLAASGILLDAREALHSLWVYCSQMLVLFRSDMPWRVFALFATAALLGTGVIYAAIGFMLDVSRTRRLEKEASERGKELFPRVTLTDNTSYSAWTAGIFRPRIYLSEHVYERLGEGEREALLAHEQAHVRNNDLLKRAVMDVLARCFFFLPSLKESFQQIRFMQEVRADREALALTSRKSLCGLYLSSLKSGRSEPVAAFAYSSRRLAAVLDGETVHLNLSARKLAFSLAMIVGMTFASIAGFQVREAHAEAGPVSCEALATVSSQNFTQLIGPIELYTPAPQVGVCAEANAC